MGFPVIDMGLAFAEIDERLIALGWIEKQDEYRNDDRTGRCRVFIKSERFEKWALQVLALAQKQTLDQVMEWYNEQPPHLRYTRLKQRLPFDSVLTLIKNLRDASEGHRDEIEDRIVKSDVQ